MKILLADKQDITRAGLSYVISKIEGLETRTIEDKADLMLALKENEDTVVILDYTLFDINDAAELLILNQRFPYTRWLLFSEDLSADFVKILIASSTQFSVLLKECLLIESSLCLLSYMLFIYVRRCLDAVKKLHQGIFFLIRMT